MPSRRIDRGRALVLEDLRVAPAGLANIALVDRLTSRGFSEEEAAALLQWLRAEGELRLVSGRWVRSR